MTIRAQSDQPDAPDDLEIIEVDPHTVPLDPEEPAEAGRGTSIRGVVSLACSVVGLAFVVWMMFAHPRYPSLFGPPPAARAMAAATHVPPPRPVPG